MARGEIHVQLNVDYADDPKLRALARHGKSARGLRDLFVQMVCYCKRTMSDGFVPAEQLGLLVYPDSPTVGRKDADRLVEAGLLLPAEGGYTVASFLKRNKSREQVLAAGEQVSEGATLGNHKRWHEKRGITDPECPHCVEGESGQDPPPESPTRSGGRSVPRRRPESTESESESESPPPAEVGARETRATKRAQRLPADFTATDGMRAWAAQNVPGVDVDRELAQFRDHHTAKGSTFKDWTAAWRTWMRNADTFGHRPGTGPGTRPATSEQRINDIDQLQARLLGDAREPQQLQIGGRP